MKLSSIQSVVGVVLVGACRVANAQDSASSSAEGPIFSIQTRTDLTTTTSLPSEPTIVSVTGVTTVPHPHITTNGTNSSVTQTSVLTGTPEPTPSSIKAAGEQLSFESSMMGMVIFCALGVMIL
ncbi:uncharacterized protein E0L32_012362 [Thyridium curvatum]|uniref:Uncharacterized protein n=1 Tax=Thyridium curvatum TaxID=1093900 RepID=A0A507BJL7_9PEZI|nr:uncharacterized protein E0L32_012362 [Thyridium curvatum]TPX16810.1 hypothetical protein E0L32_012362 [Thyridium curvatum]